MGDGIYVALSGAARQVETLDTIATNLANASTPGYQRLRLAFRAELARAADGSPLRFAATARSVTDATPGAIRETGRPLDVALPAGSFLAVRTERGERYTRAGSLAVSPTGELRAGGGASVVGEDGKVLKITPEDAPVAIAPDGRVRQGERVVGRLRVVSFDRPDALVREGASLLAAPPQAGAPRPSAGELNVGALEESNAVVVRELADMIAATRAFEAAEKTIDAFREADKTAASRIPVAT
jgi:flagellar basal body rod protein FlgG